METIIEQPIADFHERKLPAGKRGALLENRLTAYLTEGGFPEVQGLERHYRISILQEYLDVVVLRDIVERHSISNIVALWYMIRHLLNSPAGLFSAQKFYNNLKSQGIACGKNTLHEFFDYLSDAYLFSPSLSIPNPNAPGWLTPGKSTRWIRA